MARHSVINKKEKVRKEHLLSLREPVHYCCEGCGKVDPNDITLCSAYIKPHELWRMGGCFLATHVRKRVDEKVGKVRVGQQKQKRKK